MKIKRGIDNKWYAVFANNYEADMAEWWLGLFPRACFGQFDNAYCLTYWFN